jgi:hypothetical protein
MSELPAMCCYIMQNVSSTQLREDTISQIHVPQCATCVFVATISGHHKGQLGPVFHARVITTPSLLVSDSCWLLPSHPLTSKRRHTKIVFCHTSLQCSMGSPRHTWHVCFGQTIKCTISHLPIVLLFAASHGHGHSPCNPCAQVILLCRFLCQPKLSMHHESAVYGSGCLAHAYITSEECGA